MNHRWSDKDRIAAASKLLIEIQADIYAGRYSEPNRPNMMSVMHVLHSEPDLLNGLAGDTLRKFLQLQDDGLFIVIEGGDMVGKSVQAELLARRIASTPLPKREPHDSVLRRRVMHLSFPAYQSSTGKLIDDWLHGRTFLAEEADRPSTEDEALIFQCLQTVDKYALAGRVREALQNKTTVVSCRWWPSAYVYGGDDGLDKTWLLEVSSSLPRPDVFILLDGDPQKLALRASSRSEKADRYDLDASKQTRIAASYRALWKSHERERSWQVVNAEGGVDEVAEGVWRAVTAATQLTDR